MRLWGCCQKRLAFESVVWVKRSALTQYGWAFSNLLRAQIEQKSKKKKKNEQILFFLSWISIYFSCPRKSELLDLEPSDSGTCTSSHLVLRSLASDWIIPLAVLAFQFADRRLRNFSASIAMTANSYNKSPFESEVNVLVIQLCATLPHHRP